MSGRIIIPGGAGFIGRSLSQHLHRAGYDVIVLTRRLAPGEEHRDDHFTFAGWDGESIDGWGKHTEEAFAIINLSGENIGSGLWTKQKRKKVIGSRISAGKAITDAIGICEIKPKVVIQVSGIGYYGDGGNNLLDESSGPGSGFLVEVAGQWEQSVKKVEELGVRLVTTRLGVVLGKDGGFLSRVILPFRFFLGGHLGSGEQWISWIHLSDVVRAIHFVLENEELNGVFNLCSPNPMKSRDFFRLLGQVIHRPSFMHIPSFALKLFMGQMAEELILSGQRAMPKRLLESEYGFLYPTLEPAFRNILNPK